MTRPVLFYGWFVVATAFFITFVTTGARIGFGVFVIPMSDDFGWNRSTISLAASVGSLVNGASQPFIGRLYDRHGGRKVALIGLVVFGISTVILVSTPHILFLIFLYGVVGSMAISATSLEIMGAILTRWFRRKRATVLGINTAGASLGGLIIVPFSMYLIQATSWRITWVVLGALVLVLALPLAFLLMRDDPKKMNLQPDGDQEPQEYRHGSPDPTQKAPLEVESWRACFRTLPIWQLSGAYFVCGFTTGVMSAHFVPYAIDQGFSSSTAANAFGLMSSLNVVGVVAVSALSDRFGRKNLLALVYAVRGCAYATLLLAPGAWRLWGFVLLSGFSWWATAPLTTSLTADVYGLKALGAISGITLLAHNVGGAASIQFAGLMRDVTGEYTIPFAIAGLMLVPAVLASFSVQEKKYSIKYQVARAATGAYGD